MSHWTLDDSLNEENDADDIPEPFYSSRKATIYAVDASLAENRDWFAECLECIEANLLKNMLESPKDLSGVIFFNTEKTVLPKNAEEDFAAFSQTPHCSILLPLNELSKSSISYFKSFMQSEDYFDFNNDYGASEDNSFVDMLWMCSRMLMVSKKKLAVSNILIFTNNEQPYLPGSGDLQKTFQRAKDLSEMNVEVSVVPTVDEFDYELFFKEFLCIANKEDADAFRFEPPAEQRETLKSRLFQLSGERTCVRHLIFKITKDIGISCDVHRFIQRTWKPSSVKIHRDTNQVVSSVRSYVVKEDEAERDIDDVLYGGSEANEFEARNNNNVGGTSSGEVERRVLPGDYVEYQEFCGKAVAFEPEELKRLRAIGGPGINLLGFKPISSLKQRFFTKHCLFLYPNEQWMAGSSKLFRALWEKCLEKKKYALCTLILRRFVAPQYIALVPQTQENDGNDGFKIVYLPFQDDCNELNVLDLAPPEISEKSVELFNKLAKKLQFQYNPRLFSNPSHMFFYANIEALVYDEDMKETVDNTLPDTDRQDRKIQPFIEPLREELGTEEAKAKRLAKNDAGGSAAKVQKTDLSLGEIELAISSGRASSCTVQNLKDYIKSRGKSFPGKAVKKDLCQIAEELV